MAGLKMIGGNVTTTVTPETEPVQPKTIILKNKKTKMATPKETLARKDIGGTIAKVGTATAVVLGVVAAAAIGWAALGSAAAAGTTTSAAARVATSTAPTIYKTFTGKVPIANLMSPTGVMTVQRTNAAIAAQTGSLVSKIATTLKNPAVATGIVLGSLSAAAYYKGMTSNEKGDTVVQLSIGLRDALKSGDTEGASKIKEMLDDLANPSFLEKLEANIPFINYMGAVVDKIKAAKMVSDIAMGNQQKAAAEAGTEGTTGGTTNSTQDWNAIFAAQLKRQEDEREADLKAQAASIKMWADAKADQRDADAAYYRKVIAEADERARKKAEANEKYWLEVYKMREESQASKLSFGLL